MDREITDIFIRICRQILEANRAKIDGDPSIKGIKLDIRLSDCQKIPRSVSFDLAHEENLLGRVLGKEELGVYSFPDERA